MQSVITGLQSQTGSTVTTVPAITTTIINNYYSTGSNDTSPSNNTVLSGSIEDTIIAPLPLLQMIGTGQIAIDTLNQIQS